MPLSFATAATFVNLCIGVSALASAQGWGLSEIKQTIGCLQDARQLKDTLRQLGLNDTASRLRKTAQDRVAALEASPEFAAKAQDCLSIFEQVLPHCTLDPQTLVAQHSAAGIAEHWSQHIVDTAPRNLARYFEDPTTPEARFFAEVATPIIDALLRDPAFQPALEYSRWDRAYGTMQEILDLVRELREVKDTTVHQDTLFALARKIRPGVRSKEEALRELEAAADLAAEAIARGEQGSNVDSFVDEVLHRLAALTEAGELETAAQTAQEELQKAKAGMAQLRDQAIRQHVLNRDASAAAALIVERVVEDSPNDCIDALRKDQETWHVRGRDKGTRIDLEVAIALSQASLPYARFKEDRGAILNDLGLALQTLGEGEITTEPLEQAVSAHALALEELTRERAPLEWAGTQMNLGNALQTLGARETGTERLEQAIAAYERAFQVNTRKRVPLEWARTQMNLGNALQTLGARETGTDRLEQAVAAYERALEERTRERVPLEWAMTLHNLGNALLSLGERETSTDRLGQALAAYERALLEWTRERVPMQWAIAQKNIAQLHMAWFLKDQDPAQLRAALSKVDLALEVYEAANAAYYVEKATFLRDGLLAALEQLSAGSPPR